MSVQPVLNYYVENGEDFYQRELMDRWRQQCLCLYHEGIIARQTLQKRLRGINILNDIYVSPIYEWKMYPMEKVTQMPHFSIIHYEFVARF
jgi:hypothetical protein